ncbi:MAG: ribosome assembly RNA-binding protein YhbY [Deltaproteobacteria bacterium]|nr:ribosome assembly RNA-binding protein YhbY [Deltaproteobacteria bacterium]
MKPLKGFEKKYLRGLAHDLNPVVLIGKEGITDGIVRATDEGLSRHELLKIKLNDFKDKEQKETLTDELVDQTGSAQVGMIGHTAILYRPQTDPARRRIQLPAKGK